jgi:hypothetical protein
MSVNYLVFLRGETFRTLIRQKNREELYMKTAITKKTVAGVAMLGGLLVFTTAASADWGHREFRRDRRELSDARRELRNDLRRGAGRAEIARDRAAIAHERRELWDDRHDWRDDRWDYRDRYPYRYRNWRDYDYDGRSGWWNWRW